MNKLTNNQLNEMIKSCDVYECEDTILKDCHLTDYMYQHCRNNKVYYFYIGNTIHVYVFKKFAIEALKKLSK